MSQPSPTPINVVNNTSATLVANLGKAGRYALFSPLETFAGIAAKGFVDFGYFPADTKLSPTNNVTRDEVTAASREGGADVLLAKVASKIEISYDINSLTPSDEVRALHDGLAPTEITVDGLTDATVVGIDPSRSLVGRLIIVRKSKGSAASRPVKVVWHPRVELTPNSVGDSNNQQTLQFQANVQAYTYTPTTALADMADAISQYGAVFTVANNELPTLLALLAAEALPA